MFENVDRKYDENLYKISALPHPLFAEVYRDEI
jgi:hypothetical protein